MSICHGDTCSCADCFKNLGIDSRLKIYSFLQNSGKSDVSSIVTHLGLTQPTVSYHLKEMKDAGLLKSEKSGKNVIYFINTKCSHCDNTCMLSTANFGAVHPLASTNNEAV